MAKRDGWLLEVEGKREKDWRQRGRRRGRKTAKKRWDGILRKQKEERKWEGAGVGYRRCLKKRKEEDSEEDERAG